MKLFFAAPLSALPSDPTALGAHASRLHFAMKLFFAAPASGFPSFPTALLSHVPGRSVFATKKTENVTLGVRHQKEGKLRVTYTGWDARLSPFRARWLRGCSP